MQDLKKYTNIQLLLELCNRNKECQAPNTKQLLGNWKEWTIGIGKDMSASIIMPGKSINMLKSIASAINTVQPKKNVKKSIEDEIKEAFKYTCPECQSCNIMTKSGYSTCRECMHKGKSKAFNYEK